MHIRLWTGLATTVAAVGLAVTAGALPAAAATGPTASFTVSLLVDLGAFNADASSSVPGQTPITSYTWDFGDFDGDVVTTAGPQNGKVYGHGGVYTVKLTVTDAAGLTDSTTRQVSAFPKLSTTALLGSNLRYVTAEAGGGQPLIANRASVGGTWERLDLVDVGGDIGFRSQANGKYVTVDPATTRLTANGSAAERFQRVDTLNGAFALRSTTTGKYLSSNNGGSPLTADRPAVGAWEQFYRPTSESGLNKHPFSASNGYVKYISAESAGGRPLIANRRSPGQWETYDQIDAGKGWIALLSHANNRFVTAEAGGNQPLIANRTSVGDWELFKIGYADGLQSLRANANGKYVTADLTNGGTLIANRTEVGDWERFTVLA
ncbi:PKD domain-containing protein [Dactylosporangium sp. CS-033363]|uniref:PKD domain-containing protein n=1 Tax=Dactylosporangium sp. CS-033363 TaxID=3239935 RepID=UPI003D8C9124